MFLYIKIQNCYTVKGIYCSHGKTWIPNSESSKFNFLSDICVYFSAHKMKLSTLAKIKFWEDDYLLYFIGLQTASTVVLDAHGVDHFMRRQSMRKSVHIPTALEQR
jgi:hypothetical protein